MVYIKSDTIYLANKKYKLVTRYLSRRERFVVELPDIMQRALNQKEIQEETLSKLETTWKITLLRYKETVSAREKIIVYHFKCNAMIWAEDGKRVTFRKEEMTFAKGTALELKWYVGYRVVSEYEEYPKYLYLNGNQADRDYSNITVQYMAYTEDRERFFKALQKGLDTMILNAYNFFNETKDIHKLIDAGTINLLPAPEDKE